MQPSEVARSPDARSATHRKSPERSFTRVRGEGTFAARVHSSRGGSRLPTLLAATVPKSPPVDERSPFGQPA